MYPADPYIIMLLYLHPLRNDFLITHLLLEKVITRNLKKKKTSYLRFTSNNIMN